RGRRRQRQPDAVRVRARGGGGLRGTLRRRDRRGGRAVPPRPAAGERAAVSHVLPHPGTVGGEQQPKGKSGALRAAIFGVNDGLAAIYRAKGVPADLATDVATALMRDPEVALETHAREELGLDPDELGSPWSAAGSSFVTFAFGAFVPLVPFLISSGTTAAVW